VRDVVQFVSVFLCVVMLFVIWRRGRVYHEQAREWYTFVFISVLSILFYIAVYIDAQNDIMDSSNVSSMVRLAIFIALLLYAIYAPRRIRP
jgi:glucan phosphoethanolaminetransferase (alkaline phosphatase superfamily)